MINHNLIGNIPTSKITNFESSVKALNAGLNPLLECRVATTTNITLAGENTIDGIASIPNNTRVLVKDQTNTSENGIYLKKSGTWVRVSDFDENSEIQHGAFTYVVEGVENSNKTFMVSNEGSGDNYSIIVGTDPIVFTTVNLSIPATLEYMLNLDVNTTTKFADNVAGSVFTGITINKDFRGRLLIMGANGSLIYNIDSQTTINKAFYLSSDNGVTATNKILNSGLYVNPVVLGKDLVNGIDKISIVGMIGSNTPVATLEAALDNKADLINGKLDPTQMPNIYINEIYDSSQLSLAAFIATELDALITGNNFQINDTVRITDTEGISRLYTAYYDDLYDVNSYVETQTFETEAGDGLIKSGKTISTLLDETGNSSYYVVSLDGFEEITPTLSYVDGTYTHFSEFIAIVDGLDFNKVKLKGEIGFPEIETARAFYKDNGDNTWTIFYKRSYDVGNIRNNTQWAYAKVGTNPTSWTIVNDFVLDNEIIDGFYSFSTVSTEAHPEEVLIDGSYNPPINGDETGTTANTELNLVDGSYMIVSPNGLKIRVSKDLDLINVLPDYLTTRGIIAQVLELYQKLLSAGNGIDVNALVNGVLSLTLADTDKLVYITGFNSIGLPITDANGDYQKLNIGTIDSSLNFNDNLNGGENVYTYYLSNNGKYFLIALHEFVVGQFRWELHELQNDISTLNNGENINTYVILNTNVISNSYVLLDIDNLVKDSIEGVQEIVPSSLIVGSITENEVREDLSGLILTSEGLKVRTSDNLDITLDGDHLLFRETLRRILLDYQKNLQFNEGLQNVNGNVNLKIDETVQETFHIEGENLIRFGGAANGTYLPLSKSAIIRTVGGELLWYGYENISYPSGLDVFHILFKLENNKYYVIAFQDSFTTLGVAQWIYFETETNPTNFIEGEDITPLVTSIYPYFNYSGGRFDPNWDKVDGAFIPPVASNLETGILTPIVSISADSYVTQTSSGVRINGSSHPNLKVKPTFLLERGVADVIFQEIKQELTQLVLEGNITYSAGKHIDASALYSGVIASSLNFEDVNDVFKNATLTHVLNLGNSEPLKGEYRLLTYGVFETLDSNLNTNGFIYRGKNGNNYPVEYGTDNYAIYGKTSNDSNQIIAHVKRLSDDNYFWVAFITDVDINSIIDGTLYNVLPTTDALILTDESLTPIANGTQITEGTEVYYRPSTFKPDITISYQNTPYIVKTGLTVDQYGNVINTITGNNGIDITDAVANIKTNDTMSVNSHLIFELDGRMGVDYSDDNNIELFPEKFAPRSVIKNNFDSLLLKGKIIDVLNTPPVSPSLYDTYIVGIGTGDWLGQDTKITIFNGSIWEFKTPTEGSFVYSEAIETYLKFVNSNWSRFVEVSNYGNTLIVNPSNPQSSTTYSRTDALVYGAQFSTILSAVLVSQSTDTILVKRGTYNENITFSSDTQTQRIVFEEGCILNGDIIRTYSSTYKRLHVSSLGEDVKRATINGTITMPASGSASDIVLKNLVIINNKATDSYAVAQSLSLSATTKIYNCHIENTSATNTKGVVLNLSYAINSTIKTVYGSTAETYKLEAINSKFISANVGTLATARRNILHVLTLRMVNCYLSGCWYGVSIFSGNHEYNMILHNCDIKSASSNIYCQSTGFPNTYLNVTGGNYICTDPTATTNIRINDGVIVISGTNATHDITASGGDVQGSFNKYAGLKIFEI